VRINVVLAELMPLVSEIVSECKNHYSEGPILGTWNVTGVQEVYETIK
jgi:hypothetical protein